MDLIGPWGGSGTGGWREGGKGEDKWRDRGEVGEKGQSGTEEKKKVQHGKKRKGKSFCLQLFSSVGKGLGVSIANNTDIIVLVHHGIDN